MCFQYRTLIFTFVLVLCPTTARHETSTRVCVIPANHEGIFVYHPEQGKDYTHLSDLSQYWDNGAEIINFTREGIKASTWIRDTSLNKNVVDQPVLDQRWENFFNNHDDHRNIYQILQNIKNKTIFLSARVHKEGHGPKILTQEKWSHLKSNDTGIFLCEQKSTQTYDCGQSLKIESIHKYYTDTASDNIWKLHNYTYWYKNTTNATKEMIYKNENNNCVQDKCISIYLAICKECNITLHVESNNQSFEHVPMENIRGVWNTTEMCFKNMTNCFTISVQTGKSDSAKHGFWAIGEIGYVTNPSKCRYENVRFRHIYESEAICESSLNQKLSSYTSFESVTHLCQTEMLSSTTASPMIPIHLSNVTVHSDSYTTETHTSATTESTFFIAHFSVTVWLTILIPVVTLLSVLCFVAAFYFKRTKMNINFIECKDDNRLIASGENALYEEIDNNYTTSIKVNDFSNYVENVCSGKCNELRDQLNTLLDSDFSEQTTKNLSLKNASKMVSKTLTGNHNIVAGNYMNATYIQGFASYKEYIITQSPVQDTIIDFWMMIWQKNVSYIVMITTSNENYDCYWPKSTKVLKYADIQVSAAEMHNRDHYYHNVLAVRRGGKTRMINHLHYYAWNIRDLTSFPSRIVPFLDHLLTIPHYNSPVLVHCIDGIEKSGIIVLCDTTLRSLPITNVINIYSTVKHLKKYRSNIISSLEEYKLAHLIINHFLKKNY